MTRKILGLDIRNSSIAAVLLTSGLKGNTIESFFHVVLDADTQENNTISEALQKIVEQTDIADSQCIVSFPVDEISFRNLKVPFRDQKKISQMLPYELEPLLPYSTDDLLLDFQIIPSADNSEHTDIITAAVRKSYIEKCIAELAVHGIVPRIITEGNSQATLCLNHFSDIPDHSIIIDIDSKRSTMMVFVSGHITLIRSMQLHSSKEKRAGLLCSDIQRTLAASETLTGSDIKPEAIFLTGPGLGDLDYRDEIADFFNIATHTIDLAHVSGVEHDVANESSWLPWQMDNALSLALTDITGVLWMNFSQKRFEVKKQWVEHKKNIIKSGLLAGLILFLAILNLFFDFHLKSKEIDRLDFRIKKILQTSFPEVTKMDYPLHQMKVKLDEMKGETAISEGGEDNILTIDILNEISTLIPGDINVELERLVIGPDNVTISGETAAFDAVDDIKGRLEKGELFNKVVISSANTDRSENKVRFKLKIMLGKKAGPEGSA